MLQCSRVLSLHQPIYGPHWSVVPVLLQQLAAWRPHSVQGEMVSNLECVQRSSGAYKWVPAYNW